MNKFLMSVLGTTFFSFSSLSAMEETTSKLEIPGLSCSIYDLYKGNLLKNFDLVDYQAVKEYREIASKFNEMDENFEDTVSRVEPIDTLKSFSLKTLDFLNEMATEYPQLNSLKAEISFRHDYDQVTPLWYFVLFLRIASAISSVSAEELNFIKHIIDPGEALIVGLTKRDAWKVFEKAQEYVVSFREQDKGGAHVLHFPPEINFDAADEAIDSLHRHMSLEIFYPLLGKGKVSIPFLVHALINDIYPISLPKKPLKAHGITLSPLGFTVHDLLHAHIDQRRNSLEQYFVNELGKQVKRGDRMLKSKPFLIEMAVQKHTLLNSGLMDLFNCGLAYLKQNESEEAKIKRFMAGFFWALHENTVSKTKIYKTGDFSKVISLMLDKKPEENADLNLPSITQTDEESKDKDIEKISHDWESPQDVFVTSPLTGEMFITDKQAADIARNQLKGNEMIYHDDPYEIVALQNYIDVIFTMKDAGKKTFSLPTLYFKWNNANDNISILKYAGVTIEKPSIEEKGHHEAREIAISLLENIENEIDRMQTDFFDFSQTLAESKSLMAENISLKDNYAEKFAAIEDQYKASLQLLNLSLEDEDDDTKSQ